MVLRDIDDEELHRFVDCAFDLACNDLRLGNLNFVALAAHRFEDYGELQFTASHHAPRVGRHIFDADTDVAARFEIGPLGDFARGPVIAFAPRPWRVVEAEGAYHGRLGDTVSGTVAVSCELPACLA